MKKIIIALFCALHFIASAQQQFTAPVPHWSGAPSGMPSTQGARVRYDQAAGKWYFWSGSTWLLQPDGVAQVSGLLPPAYTPGTGQSQFAVNGANELYRWRTGTTWDCINCAGAVEPARQILYGTGTGTDSDVNFTRNATTGSVQILGSNGKLSVQTTDTTGLINANSNTKPLFAVGNSSENPIWIAPYFAANSGLIQGFGIGRQFFDSPNGFGDNQTVQLGFNVGGPNGAGDIYDISQPQMSLRFENSFRTPGSHTAYEFHCPQVSYPGGVVRRPISGYFSNVTDTVAGHISFTSDYFNINDYKTGQQRATWSFGEFGPFNPYQKGINFTDTARVYFERSHIRGRSGIIGRKADNSADIWMLSTDDQDRIILGGAGETSVAAYNRFNITNAGVLWNEEGNIFIGDNTNKCRLWVTSPVEEVQSWGRNNLSNQSLVLRLDGPVNQPTRASFATYVGGVRQMLRFDLRAPDNSFFMSSLGRIGLGTDNPQATMHAVSPSGPAVAVGRFDNVAGNMNVFVSNASPESAISATPGSITLANVADVGRVYVKRTGTGNTGHSELQQKADAYVPLQKTDAAAVNGELYYSTTQNKLCYKDPGGTVNPLY